MGSDALPRFSRITSHLLALAVCAVTVTIGLPLREVLDLANIVMLMLLGVVLVAAVLGRSPAVLASFVSVGAFDFFFVPPRLSFLVSDVQYLVTFAVMLAVSLIISHLTTTLRASMAEALERERRTQALYALAKALAGAMTAEDVVERVAAFVREQTGRTARFFLPDGAEGLQEFPLAGCEPAPDATWLLEMVYRRGAGNPAGCIVDRGDWLAFPLAGATRCRGVMSVAVGGGEEGVRTLGPMLEAVASLAAIALERLHFVDVAQASRMETEAERLRSSILSSISHDLRTPLTVLFGRADALALADGALGDEEREAARAIRDQAGRLHQMVENLLDMARLQAGVLRLRKEWQAIDEVIGASIHVLGEALRDHPVTVRIGRELPFVALDAVLMERVLCNLIENAAKYSPAGAPISIDVTGVGDGVEVAICDRGAGFPPGSLPRLFGLFERGVAESVIQGGGLGLAICRAIVQAHGGRINAQNRIEGGACVRFTVPVGGEPPPIEPEQADVEGGGR